MTEAVAPETAYTNERLMELTEIEPCLDGVLSALSELAARHGSAEEIVAVEQLSELRIHAARMAEEFILAAGAATDALERRRRVALGTESSGRPQVKELVRALFAVEEVRIVLARSRAPGHPLSLLDGARHRQANTLGTEVDRALSAYTGYLRDIVSDLVPAEAGTTAPMPLRARTVRGQRITTKVGRTRTRAHPTGDHTS